MTQTIITIAQHNANHQGLNMKFQNADGSIKKTGYVVTNGHTHKYCKSLAIAQAEVLNVLDDTNYTAPSWDAHYNS